MFELCGSKTTSIPPVFSSLLKTFVHVLPPSVGAENSTLLIRSERMTQRRDEDDVGISRIHNNRTDLVAILQSDILPGLAGIDRFVNSESVGCVSANRGFTRAGVNHVMVGSAQRRSRRLMKCLLCRIAGVQFCTSVDRFPNCRPQRAPK